MLRLPAFELHHPASITEALELAAALPGARFIAGGTDILPNLKHEMIEAEHVVSLAGIPELRGICVADDGGLSIGPMTKLSEVAASEDVRRVAPALATAAGLVAGPQHRNQGTIGGNVMLDTRCQWINQSFFWREALGFCLKKDGTECHVIAGGKRCVAAVSNDTIAPLYTLGAQLRFMSAPTQEMLSFAKTSDSETPGLQTRDLAADALFKADGAYNKKTQLNELLTAIRIPATPAGHKGAYQKLRLRNSIDFPLLGVAARLDFDDAGLVTAADVVVIAMAARPVRVKRTELFIGTKPGTPEFEAAQTEVISRAERSCKALPNIPGDEEWRSKMVPVFVRRALTDCV